MTTAQVRGWLSARQPAPPAVLAERLEHVLSVCPSVRLSACRSLPDALGALGVYALDSLAERPATSRDVALDLLAADAFVTYAFEAAAESGADSVAIVAATLLAKVHA